MPCLAQVEGGLAPLGSGGLSVPPDATLRAFIASCDVRKPTMSESQKNIIIIMNGASATDTGATCSYLRQVPTSVWFFSRRKRPETHHERTRKWLDRLPSDLAPPPRERQCNVGSPRGIVAARLRFFSAYLVAEQKRTA